MTFALSDHSIVVFPADGEPRYDNARPALTEEQCEDDIPAARSRGFHTFHRTGRFAVVRWLHDDPGNTVGDTFFEPASVEVAEQAGAEILEVCERRGRDWFIGDKLVGRMQNPPIITGRTAPERP